MKAIYSILFLLLTASANPVLAVDIEYLHGLGDTRYHLIHSEQVGRDYHIFVMLPSSYESSGKESYPTIYVLDGGGLFPMLTAYYRYLSFGEEIPEAIIVGISYGSDTFAYGSDTFEGGNYRSTDYTAPSSEREFWGGAEKFQGFLGDELLPMIEKKYRSDNEHRVIFGQSLGGQFVLYSALTKPDLFWGHIASNPALHRNLPFFLQSHIEPGYNWSRSRLFVASATNDDPRFREPAQQWIQHWSAVESIPWDFKTYELEGHSHMSAPPASFRAGLSWMFSETQSSQPTGH